jgi:hypothetical protein
MTHVVVDPLPGRKLSMHLGKQLVDDSIRCCTCTATG